MTFDFESLALNVNRYLVTPLNAFGLGGFVFDVEGETSVTISAEITDHFLEDNSTVQDHIAIKPKRVVLKSYVGELIHRKDESTDTFVQNAVQKLTVLSQYTPAISQGAQQLLSVRKSILEASSDGDIQSGLASLTVNKVLDYWAFVKNLVGQQSRQQQAYIYFKAMAEQKLLVSVQTPFEYMTNMAIETITARQDETSKFISDFSITLKEIRTAEILNVPAGKVSYVPNTASGTTSAAQGLYGAAAPVPTVESEPLDIPEDSLEGRSRFQYQKTKKLGPMLGQPLTSDQQDFWYGKFLEEFKGTNFQNGL